MSISNLKREFAKSKSAVIEKACTYLVPVRQLWQILKMVYTVIAGGQNPNDNPITLNKVLDNFMFCSMSFQFIVSAI